MMNPRTLPLWLVGLVPALGAAQTVDFENLPGAFEGLVITDQFEEEFGVTFSLANGGNPVLAEVGNPQTAFVPSDTPLPGQGIGQYFLTDDGAVAGAPPDLVITYTVPVSSASGDILDIDFSESWRITAFDESDVELTSIDLDTSSPGTGNQIATRWAINVGTESIKKIIIAFTGVGSQIGLAFDNFAPTSDTAGAEIPVRAYTAVELEFDSIEGRAYRVESSLDGNSWTLERNVTGEEGTTQVFFSTRDSDRKLFRVIRL